MICPYCVFDTYNYGYSLIGYNSFFFFNNIGEFRSNYLHVAEHIVQPHY